MKTFKGISVLSLILVFSLNAHAVTFEVTGPCNEISEFSGSYIIDLSKNVGEATLKIFSDEKIPFVGSVEGISSILNTPTGLDAIEVISDTKMRAYGWCFSINGHIPDVLMNEVYFTKQNDKLSWFYAFSTYDQGVWTDYCVPSYKIKAPQFCKNP